jgi:hypothetical protein
MPDTRFSAVPCTISTMARPPAEGSRVNSTPEYSASTMRWISTLPAPAESW